MKTRLAVAVTLTIALAPLAAGQAGRARMRADLEFQCSPPLEGRASLSRGADAAAWFLATEMLQGRPRAPRGPGLPPALDREAARAGMTLGDEFDRDSSMRALFRCDHLSFLQHGVPAVWLFGGFHPG